MKGIVIFARDNEQFSYSQMACLCAAMARKHLSGFDEICLITDDDTLGKNKKDIDLAFDRVIK